MTRLQTDQMLIFHSKPKISLKASFAPTAEAKKAGKASSRAEEMPKHKRIS